MTIVELTGKARMHVKAAEGWLTLGDLTKAKAELHGVPAKLHAHPDVLEVRWDVDAQSGKWDACVETGTTLTKVRPQRRSGWQLLASALRHQGQFRAAIEALNEALLHFKEDSHFSLALACCYSRLNDFHNVKLQLRRAFKGAPDRLTLDRLRLRALDEQDLEPFWTAHAGDELIEGQVV